MIINEPMQLFDFTKNSDLSNWNVVDDIVMGGRSDGHFEINDNGVGVFYGDVSLENYGGFSSVRYRFGLKKTKHLSKVTLRLKGDGKRYQFRIKSTVLEKQSYISYFETTGDWQIIEIQLSNLYPTFKGRILDLPNYPLQTLEQLAFLVSNKKEENFVLQIDSIVFS